MFKKFFSKKQDQDKEAFQDSDAMIVKGDFEALLILKERCYENYYDNREELNWSREVDVHEWEDIKIENGRVVELQMFGKSWSGELPKELGHLTELRVLSAENSYLEGNFPKEIGQCTKLKKINIDTKVDGFAWDGFPEEMKNLRELEEISLIGTPDFSVDDNPDDTLLQVAVIQKNLRYLALTGFYFSTIPPELGALINLEELHLSSNHFSGSIPKELENLKKLQDIDLSANYLTGCVPKALYDKFGEGDFYQLRDGEEVDLPPCSE